MQSVQSEEVEEPFSSFSLAPADLSHPEEEKSFVGDDSLGQGSSNPSANISSVNVRRLEQLQLASPAAAALNRSGPWEKANSTDPTTAAAAAVMARLPGTEWNTLTPVVAVPAAAPEPKPQPVVVARAVAAAAAAPPPLRAQEEDEDGRNNVKGKNNVGRLSALFGLSSASSSSSSSYSDV
jgi:hypothetical protein